MRGWLRLQTHRAASGIRLEAQVARVSGNQRDGAGARGALSVRAPAGPRRGRAGLRAIGLHALELARAHLPEEASRLRWTDTASERRRGEDGGACGAREDALDGGAGSQGDVVAPRSLHAWLQLVEDDHPPDRGITHD